MGNNTSSLPVRRKSSVSSRHRQSQEIPKSAHSHHEYSKQQNIQGQGQLLNLPISTENGYPPPYKPKAIVSPNVFLTDNDYFGKLSSSGDDGNSKINPVASEMSEVMSGSYDDDYDIDEDLINKNASAVGKDERQSDEYRTVLVKYVDYEGNSRHRGGRKQDDDLQVYLIGNFNNWSKKIKLNKDYDGVYKIMITLPLGIYKVKFLINNEIKYSEDLPIATDKSGNVVNWFEVDDIEQSNNNDVFDAGVIEKNKISNNKRKSSTSFLHSTSQLSIDQPEQTNKEEYSQEIPEIFHQSDEILPVDEEFLHRNPIPELPVYLNNNYLNKHFNTHHYNSSSDTAELKKDKKLVASSGLNSHILPHVNLNHLLTSNIKNEVLSVACTTRYSGKFITQIMYSPSE